MPETSEKDNLAWKIKMAHNFLLRSIFSDGYEELMAKEMAGNIQSNSVNGSSSNKVEQDTPTKKVCPVSS